MKHDRKPRPRAGGAAAGFGKPRASGAPPRGGERGAARSRSRFESEDRPRPPRVREEKRGAEARGYGDPYQRVQRPARVREEGGRGFTVTLDPDVARVFRGDASVNKALRLVLQLTQVVQGPRGFGERPRPPRGYQGSAEARGFTRKPRFEADDEGDIEE